MTTIKQISIEAAAPASADQTSYTIRGGITLRNPQAPEAGNLALHVCQNPEDVMKNRETLAKSTLPLENWVLPWQKHTCTIARVGKDDHGKGAKDAQSSILETDGIYTTEPNTLIGVFTADCLGILLADPTLPLVAAVHSGWKGTVQNILYKLLCELAQQKLLRPESLQVWISPSISADSFEIGPEVKEQLLLAGQDLGLDYTAYIQDTSTDRSYADHPAMNLDVLRKFGIPMKNVHLCAMNTRTNPDCFSYRRDGRQTGEHFTYGWIEQN